MTSPTLHPAARRAWSSYWRGAEDADSQAVRGDEQSERLDAFWRERLGAAFAGRSHARLLDLACGTGIVTRIALDVGVHLPSLHLECHCTDYAPAALTGVRDTMGDQVAGLVVANARKLPLDSGGFDLVVSQYGLEYAGLEAFAEAARVTAPGGGFLALVHRSGGAIYEECEGNLDVLRAIEKAALLPRFEALFALVRKADAGRAAPQAARRRLDEYNRAATDLGRTLKLSRPGAALEHATRLLADLGQLFTRRAAYAGPDVERWIAGQKRDLADFRWRMQTMLGAALGDPELRQVRELMLGQGLGSVTIGDLVLKDGDLPAAWILDARRPI